MKIPKSMQKKRKPVKVKAPIKQEETFDSVVDSVMEPKQVRDLIGLATKKIIATSSEIINTKTYEVIKTQIDALRSDLLKLYESRLHDQVERQIAVYVEQAYDHEVIPYDTPFDEIRKHTDEGWHVLDMRRGGGGIKGGIFMCRPVGYVQTQANKKASKKASKKSVKITTTAVTADGVAAPKKKLKLKSKGFAKSGGGK